MKDIIKRTYILTIVFVLYFAIFTSAKSSFISTDCYWKNNNYQCTTKACSSKNIKSCKYKTIKQNPPVYNNIKIVYNINQTIDNFGLTKNIAVNKNINSVTWNNITTWNIAITWNNIVTWNIIASWSIISSGVIANTNSWNTSTGFKLMKKNSIVNISNTTNTISDLGNFYNNISGSLVTFASGAKFSIIQFGDFECIYCKKFHQNSTLQTVMSKYPNNINYYFVNFPLTQIHKNAAYFAKWYICTAAQDKSQAANYINYLYTQSGDPIWLLDWFKKWLDVNSFDACLLDKNTDNALNYQINIGNYVWVTGTPAIMLINNDTYEYELIAGAYDATAYQSVLQNRQDKIR